jgi:DNA polymerase III sliding clamp (beta) subunit (PCNA family)
MRLETINTIINALNITSNDCTRMALAHVLIEKQNEARNTISVTACDGHRLTQVFIDDELFGHIPEDGLLILDDEIKKLKAAKIKRVDSFKIENNSWIINGVVIGFEKNKQYFEYFNYKQVIPNYKNDDCLELCFNAEYLEEMLKAMRDNKKENGVVLKFNKNKKGSPIVVSIRGSQSSSGVLMQMRK